ncbi:drebrin 1, isoform CRA_c [Rattus norvegicus]|uniref:Drebrin 1, isoform CRA_c n=1 Tax=Rattus norvegicus TaxID=10116 RepID=A6KAS5_RAT|nr:drebrin 1, isoform CRA_c [Rattus norvegicus]
MKKSESEVEEAAAIIAQRPDNPREFFRQQERVASASGGSCDAPSPFNHRPGRPYCPFIKASDSGPSSSSSSSSSPPRTPFPYITCHRTPNLSSSLPCSHLDSHRRMAPTPIPTRSPSDSSTASTPITEQIERALDEVTSSQPPPPPPPPPPAQEAQESAPRLDGEEVCKEAKVAAAPQVWAGCAEEPPRAQEPPLLQSSPTEDLMCTESPEQAVLAASPEPDASVTSVADAHAADTIETTTATTATTIADNVTPAAASLIDLWPGNGEEASTPQAEPRVPTPPSGAEASLAEVPLLNEAAQEPLPPVGEGCANLLNFDELPEPPATFCDPEEEAEGEPLAASQVLTMPSALEEVDQVLEQELEPEPHLLTNGETTQKEGTQVGQGEPGGRDTGQCGGGGLTACRSALRSSSIPPSPSLHLFPGRHLCFPSNPGFQEWLLGKQAQA